MRRHIITLLAVGALLSVAERPRAATPPEITCVRQARTDEKSCESQARAQCTATYLGAVPACFGANASCASDCLTAQSACETGPHGRQSSCSASCDAQSSAQQKGCRGRPDPQTCSLGVKLKALKCKQKCVRVATPALQSCSTAFNGCLNRCVAPASGG